MEVSRDVDARWEWNFNRKQETYPGVITETHSHKADDWKLFLYWFKLHFPLHTRYPTQLHASRASVLSPSALQYWRPGLKTKIFSVEDRTPCSASNCCLPNTKQNTTDYTAIFGDATSNVQIFGDATSNVQINFLYYWHRAYCYSQYIHQQMH